MDQEFSLPGRTIRLRFGLQAYVMVGGLGFYGYFLLIGLALAGAQIATNWSFRVSFPAFVAACAVLGVAGSLLLWWRTRGREYCMNDEGIWFEIRGVAQWAFKWGDLVLSRGGLLGSRIKIALPNGKWYVLPGMLGAPGRDRSEFYSILRRRNPKRERLSAAASGRYALICLAAAAPIMPLVPKPSTSNDAVFDLLESAGGKWTVELTVLVAMQLVALLGVFLVIGAFFFGMHYLDCKLKERRPKPEAALTELQEFRAAAFGHPTPVELELDVPYRYVGRAELAAEIKQMNQVLWIMSLVCGLVILALAFFASWGFVLGGALILLLQICFRPMIAMRQSLGDTVVRTESGLTIIRDGVSHQFPAEPARKTRLKPGHDGAAIGTWWEEYSDGRVRYRVDRRYLVPVDDDPE